MLVSVVGKCMELQPVTMMRVSGILLVGLLASGPALAADLAASSTTGAAVAVQLQPSAGGVRYVSDEFKVTLRSGPGLKFQILRMLSTGDRLTVVQQDDKAGYTEVNTADGTQGWVLTRYLMNHPTAQAQLNNARQALSQANAKLKSLTDTLSQTQAALKANTQAEADLKGHYDALQKQYTTLRETAKNAVAVADENSTLKKRTATLSRQLAAVSSENETLKDTGLIRWFMAGGAVLLVGLILGLMMPHLLRRRRDNWFN